MIGKLRDRIDILNKTEAVGDIGQITNAWSVTQTVWAWVKKITPKYIDDANNRKNAKHYEIIIRDNTNVGITSKIRYNGQYMRIDGFGEVSSTDEFMKLICVESANEVVTI